MKTKTESILGNKRIRIHVLGCRSNLYEAEALASSLSGLGAIPCEQGPFDAAVVVSCMVTAEAERKCRQIVRRLKREEPEAPVVACGCWAQLLDEDKARELGIDALLGNRRKHRVMPVLGKLLQQGNRNDILTDRGDISTSSDWDPLFLDCPRFHVRAFVKIQDGCDHGCSYCIIPTVRGKPVSRDLKDILNEVKQLVLKGIREIVLTGIHLAFYGRGETVTLGELVHAIDEIDGIDRIRFGSIEPFGLEEGLLETIATSKKICPHLHLPLQSGDDRVLRRMGRGYTSEEFLELVKKVRKAFGEDFHLSTDVIVGFPGEDDKAFRRTLDVLEKAEAGRVHAFPFSPRQGTPAADFPDRPAPEEVKTRMKEMLQFASDKQQQYALQWVGRKVPVLVEKCEAGSVSGYTPQFIKAVCKDDFDVNSIAEVEIIGCHAGVLEGRVCYNAFSGGIRGNRG
ncbi:MAG: tRNA (N(6)-L-threonylcarbamoyladenosine(37)-C(2))-methylthiotransferase MtaB [Thermovirgaceae bacterium]